MSQADVSQQLAELSRTLQQLVQKVDDLSLQNGANPQNERVHQDQEPFWHRSIRDTRHTATSSRNTSAQYPTDIFVNGSINSPNEAVEIVQSLKTDIRIADTLSCSGRNEVTYSSSFELYPELGRLFMPSAELVF